MLLKMIQNYYVRVLLVTECWSCGLHLLRTKALVLELLAAVCLVRGGHEIILSAFDHFKTVINSVKPRSIQHRRERPGNRRVTFAAGVFGVYAF